MNRPIFVGAMLVAAAATLAAQNQQPNPYAGTSNPPPDSTIQDSQPAAPAPLPKPSPAQYPQQATPAQPSAAQMPPAANSYAPANSAQGTDSGVAQVVPDSDQQPVLNQRPPMDDPDGDIVHPEQTPPGTLAYGTQIRVRLLEYLSTAYNRDGDTFRTRVLSDVYQGDQVLIPAGSEIDGRVTNISTGHVGGHGSMILHPETVILPSGAKFRMYAQLTATPNSKTRVGSEGTVAPGSRMKKDGIEYGVASGIGAASGAIVAGPAGAIAGTLIGASAITIHLLVDHPQAKLEPGTTLEFMLTEPLNLVSATQPQPQGQAMNQPQAQDQSADQPAAVPDPQTTQNQ